MAGHPGRNPPRWWSLKYGGGSRKHDLASRNPTVPLTRNRWTEAFDPPTLSGSAVLRRKLATHAAESIGKRRGRSTASRRRGWCILEPRKEARASIPHPPAARRSGKTTTAIRPTEVVGEETGRRGRKVGGLGMFPGPQTTKVGGVPT